MNQSESARLRRASELMREASEILNDFGYTAMAAHARFCALDASLKAFAHPAPQTKQRPPAPRQRPATVQRRAVNIGVYRGGC